MNKACSLSLAAIGLLLSVSTYGQSPNPLYHHLPPNADHITEINFNQLNEKGNFSAILGAIPPGNDPKTGLILDILKDPSSAGIDLGNNIFIASVSASGTGADTLDFTNIMFRLSDSAKFRALLKNAQADLEIHTVPGKGSSVKEDKLGMAWNDKLVVITQAKRDPVSGLDGQPAAPSTEDIAVEKSFAALAGFSESPWLNDPRFLSGFATNDDVHFWSTGMNFGKFMSKLMSKFAQKGGMPKGMPMPMMPNYSKNPHHAPILSTFNFGNGRIEFRMTTFSQPADAAVMKTMLDRPFNKDLLARIPDGVLLGCAAMHINPSSISDLLEKYGTSHIVDSILQKVGLKLDDLTAPFSGDFLVAAVIPDHTDAPNQADAPDSLKKKIKFYLVASLADPARLMKLGAKLSSMSSSDTAKHGPFKSFSKNMVVKDNLLVVSSSHKDAEGYFNNQKRRSTALLGDDLAMQKVVIDLKAVSTLLGSSMSNDPKMMIVTRVLDKLDKIRFTNGTMEGNNMIADFQIITDDPNTNSLTTLMGIMH